MIKFILKRLILAIITLFGVSIIVFYIIHMLPGDPVTVIFGKNPDPVSMALIRAQYYLDKPVYVQYFYWLRDIVHLDFGKSFLSKIPVKEIVFERIGRTFLLAFLSMILSSVIAIPIGIITANKRNSNFDFGISSLTLFMLSIPEFWTGLILIMIFSVFLKVLPSGGYVFPNEDLIGFFKHLILPVLSISIMQTAIIIRMVRTTMIDILQQDYVKLATANGIQKKRILYLHAFRNALIPVITVIGLTLGYALGGEVVVENVFYYPGLGLLLFNSISNRDYPIIQATILIFAFLFIIVNLIVDVVYAFINPKIRYQ